MVASEKYMTMQRYVHGLLPSNGSSITAPKRVFYSSGIRPFLVEYHHMQFLFNFVPPQLLVYNSSYTQSIFYI
jgi:hypothetical protein